jgi:hypothetical protein
MGPVHGDDGLTEHPRYVARVFRNRHRTIALPRNRQVGQPLRRNDKFGPVSARELSLCHFSWLTLGLRVVNSNQGIQITERACLFSSCLLHLLHLGSQAASGLSALHPAAL